LEDDGLDITDRYDFDDGLAIVQRTVVEYIVSVL
jgi:hypothetical protein